MADPLGCDVALPYVARLYPMGFPLVVETNCPSVVEAASSLWSGWRTGAETTPCRFRIAVRDTRSEFPRNPVPPRGQAHIVSIVHSPDHYAVCDLASSFAFACLTPDVAEDPEYLRYHFLEPIGYLMVEAAHFAPVHASCAAWNGRAVVLCGDSGVGKTSLAYHCAKEGWTYLSDDATYVVRTRDEPWVAGRPHRIRFRESARRLFPELAVFTPHLRPNGKLDIEADTRLLEIETATDCAASHVIFLQRDESVRQARLRPFPLTEAERRLGEAVCYGDENLRVEQRRALARLLQLPILGLTYPDPHAAEAALRALIIEPALAA